MTVKVGENGQVVIPKAIRDAAGLHPGDVVDVEFRDGKVVLARSERKKGPLGGRYAGSGIDSGARTMMHTPRERAEDDEWTQANGVRVGAPVEIT